MAEFTVQELMERLGTFGGRPAKPYVSINPDHWTLHPTYPSGGPGVQGNTPDELRKAVQARAVPTAEEALTALNYISVVVGVPDSFPQKRAVVRRFIEAHKEQPDGQ